MNREIGAVVKAAVRITDSGLDGGNVVAEPGDSGVVRAIHDDCYDVQFLRTGANAVVEWTEIRRDRNRTESQCYYCLPGWPCPDHL